jgi:hypothetical protein
MNEIIEQLIDFRKLDQSCFFEGKTKDGHTPLYMKLSLVPRKEVGAYGDTHFITQDIGKDRRQAGEKGPIVGNGKPVQKKAAPATTAPAPRPSAPRAPAPAPRNDFADDGSVPF